MRLATLAAAALLAAGCFGGGGGGDTTTPPPTTTGGPTTTLPPTTTTPLPTTSGAPPARSIEANLTVDVIAGQAPLTVVFNASAILRDGTSLGAGEVAYNLTVQNGTTILYYNGTGNPVDIPVTLDVGLWNATLNVSSPGYGYGLDNARVNVAAGGAPLLFDGAEAETTQWTLTSRVLIVNNVVGDPVPVTKTEAGTQSHPEGSYVTTTDRFLSGAKSWHAPYPDNYRGTMLTSGAIVVPEGGAALRYSVIGGAEVSSGNAEGLFVATGAAADSLTQAFHHEGIIAEWTMFEVPLTAGNQFIRFQFDSDASCSDESGPPGGPIGCGTGYNGGGYWIDDIQVVV